MDRDREFEAKPDLSAPRFHHQPDSPIAKIVSQLVWQVTFANLLSAIASIKISPFFSGALMGLQLSGLLAISAYWVFGNAAFWKRTLHCCWLATFLFTAGGILFPVKLLFIFGVPVLFLFPLALLASQFPNWCMRILFRWRLDESLDQAERPLGIGDLLSGTLIASLTLLSLQMFATIAKLNWADVFEVIWQVTALSLLAGLVSCFSCFAQLTRWLPAGFRWLILLATHFPAGVVCICWLSSVTPLANLWMIFEFLTGWAAGLCQLLWIFHTMRTTGLYLDTSGRRRAQIEFLSSQPEPNVLDD